MRENEGISTTCHFFSPVTLPSQIKYDLYFLS